MKSLALTSRPQVLENWPVLGSRTALFFELLKKIFWKTFFRGNRLKNFCEDLFFWRSTKNFCKDLFFFFFGEHLCLCPWSLALASSIPVLGLESVCPSLALALASRVSVLPWPWPWPRIFFVSLALASSLVSSTPPLISFLNTSWLESCKAKGFLFESKPS